MRGVLKFAALFVASSAISLAPASFAHEPSPAASRVRSSAARATSHSGRKSVRAAGRSHVAQSARASRFAAHSSAHAHPGMKLARYSREPQQTKSPATTKKKRTRRRRRSRRQSYQKAPTPERISEIQSALARGGYYQGDPNGKWDSNTVDALQKFQSANGLEPSGKLDALSLQKMGLGSDIAGVSAPKPLPPAGSVPASTPRPAASSPANPLAAAPANSSTPAAPSATVSTGSNPASSAPQHPNSSAAPSASSTSSSSPR